MRKVLFWILIVVFLFLVTLLAIAFYKEQTPLQTLQGWFWVDTQQDVSQQNIQNEAEIQKTVDTTDTIKDIVNQEQDMQDTTTSLPTGSVNNTLSEEDKEAARKLIDNLIVN